MDAFLINPINATIKRTLLPDHGDRLAHIYRLTDCTTFTTVPLGAHDTIYVDDEALLKGPVQYLFAVAGYPQPIVGKGLVVGTNARAGDAPPKLDVAACPPQRAVHSTHHAHALHPAQSDLGQQARHRQLF